MSQTFAAAAFAASIGLLAVTQRRMVRGATRVPRNVVPVQLAWARATTPRETASLTVSSRRLTLPPLPRALSQVSVTKRLDRIATRLHRTDRAPRRGSVVPAAASPSPDALPGRIPAARVPAPDRTAPAPPSRVKVALCQLAVGADKPANIAGAREAILDAARDGAALVVLPEMWNCPYANESFPAYAEVVESVEDWTAPESESESEPDSESASPSIAMLSNAAKETGVVLVGGSIPERCATTGALYNTCCVFSGDGSLVAKHRKTHLFDLDIPGEISFKESDTLTQGESLTVVDTAVGRLGVGICFDVRFPEMASAMANRGAHVLVYPGAFNTVTGPLHWELLQRARAVDTQCFVLTCSPARMEGASYQAWGHSTAVGPFAEILATADERPTTVTATMEMEDIARRRRNMPLEHQRRGDLYALHDLDAETEK